ncbi:class I SAM-dependent methyltransferase [Burkholderia sp. Ac-20365]|uniref:class I SAM-dependent methyltransferase n=1 Tax=Burkholderia sp. Ac-20365 TaxID=2703897 RepID=UPI00197CA7F2|nr:class I SAM-dependent methyltransferase [Burkholderia sp. Ac-20365]MBN3760940.1 class I SAM-dependent methyltransferase [Burkholderia sp. Ac-20365]
MNENNARPPFDDFHTPAEWRLSDDDVREAFLAATPSITTNAPGYWLRLPCNTARLIEEVSGLDVDLMRQHSMHAFVRLPQTAAISRVLDARSIYGSTDGPRQHFLELTEEGRLFFRYQTILGQWQCHAQVPADLTAALVESVAAQLPSLVLPALAKKGVKTSTRSLHEELSMLSADEGRIYLPTTMLQHYASIKRKIENAGGTYESGGFNFSVGIDAADVLDRLQGGENINLQQSTQFFATPEALARKVVAAGIDALATRRVLLPAPRPLEGVVVLEPEAGDGALARVARDLGATVVCVEDFSVNAAILRDAGFEVHERDFLTVSPQELGTFSLILANPPFRRNADIQHVEKMLKFLAPGGVLSVLMSRAWLDSNRRLHVDFRERLKAYAVTQTDVPAGAFRSSGTEVATVHLLIQSAAHQAHVPQAVSQGELELEAA